MATLDANARAEGNATGAGADAGGEAVPPPRTVRERFEQLLLDAARMFRSGRVTTLSGSHPDGGDSEPRGGPDPECPNPAEVELVAENVEAVEGVFSTGVGVNVKNEQICRYLRRAMAAAEDQA